MGCDLFETGGVTVLLYKITEKIEYLLLAFGQDLHNTSPGAFVSAGLQHLAAPHGVPKKAEKATFFQEGLVWLLSIIHEHKAKVKRKCGECLIWRLEQSGMRPDWALGVTRG
jgi:hypothetical protein